MAIAHFGDDEALFLRDPVYRNAIAMPLQQIGELAGHLTDDFTQTHAEIPWKQVKGMRTWFAHQYLAMDSELIWSTAKEDVASLEAFCKNWLELEA